MKIRVPVSLSDAHCLIDTTDLGEPTVDVTLDHTLVRRILDLTKLVKAHGLYDIRVLSEAPDWGRLTIKGKPFSARFSLLEIEPTSFRWTCMWDCSDVEVRTERILTEHLNLEPADATV